MTYTLEPEQATSFTERQGLDTGPIPISGYLDPGYYEQEIERIWKRVWLMIGWAHEIPEPGDYFVKPLPFAGTSLIVARGRDGEIRAFHNVCSHRCAEVIWNDRGNARRLRCGYHGWTYDLDGALVAVPDEENFFDLDKSKHGLTPVALETWEGFIFINLAPRPPQSLRDYLGDYYDGYHGYPFEEMTTAYRYRGVVNANWKIVRDGFLETYHFPVLHRYSFADAFSNKTENPHCHNIHYGINGPHTIASAYLNPAYVPTPMETLTYSLSQGVDSIMVKSEQQELPPGINPSRHPLWSADNDTIFPAANINLFVNFYLWHTYWPLGPDKCLLETQQLMRPPSNATERWMHEVSNSVFQFGLLEDFAAQERSQRVLASGAKTHMVLQDHEYPVRHAHHWGQQLAGPYPERSAR